jgi:hypothetical protein
MTHRNEPFIYSGNSVPVGGQPGDVLLKVQGANYYTAWRDFTYVFETYDVVLDDGEY